MRNKHCKCTYTNTKNHVLQIAPQLLHSTINNVEIPEPHPDPYFEDDDTGSTTFSANGVMTIWNEIRTYAIEFVHNLSGYITPQQLVSDVLKKGQVSVGSWKRFKCVKLGHHVPQYKDLAFSVLYVGNEVYG